jgi:DNA polymerase-3 subunit gamma/tau
VKVPELEPQPVAKAAPPPVEKATAPVVEKAPEPQPVAAVKVKEASPVDDPGELFSEDVFWSKFVSQVQVRRPLAVSWLHSATLLGIARNTIKVGFPPSESFARDSLMRPAQVSFLESLAQELTGQTMKFEFVLDPSLKAPVFAEIDLGLLNEPASASKPEVEAKPEPKAEVKAAPQAELLKADAPAASAPRPPEDFYNDPLIQSAMVKFKAKLVPAG